MLPVTQIDNFYNGLTLRSRDTINAAVGGTFMKRRPEECYDLIENINAHHNDWDTSAQRSGSSSSITSSSDLEIVALNAEMAEINKNLMKVLQVNQQVKAVTVVKLVVVHILIMIVQPPLAKLITYMPREPIIKVIEINVKSVFLYGTIEEEVYVSQPPGFVDPAFLDRVYKVEKALYGLHQAPKAYVKSASTPMETHKPLSKDAAGTDVDVHLYSDYAGASLDRKSTTGGYQFLGSRLISWQCKKQTIVANSTTEAEYIAASNCCGQVLWLQNQLLDYGYNFMQAKIHVDNESAICVVKSYVYHSKTKHIKIRHHFIRDSYEKMLIEMVKIHTDYNVADLLTKAFDVTSFGILPVSNNQFYEEIHAIVDGKAVVISESSVRSDLLFNDEDGITCLTNDDIFENLALMGYEPFSKKLTFQKGGGDSVERAITTDASLEAAQASDNNIKTQTTVMPNVDIPQGMDTDGSPRRQDTMGEGHTSGSEKGRMEHTVELTDIVPPVPLDSPLTEGYTPGSDESRPKLEELMALFTTLSNRVSTLENELLSTKSVYHKAFITLTKRVKKLEKQLKQKKSRAVVHSSDEEELSVHIEDSPKQGKMIKELDKDEDVNLVSQQEEVQETVDPSKDDDDATLTESLLNIKRSTAKDKGKGIMQETELPKKIKKRVMIQLSLDEGLAQKLYAEELANETARQEQEKYNLEKALELQRQLYKREKDAEKGDQAKEIDWNGLTMLRYHALQNRPFSKAEVRKNMVMYLKNKGGYKQSYFKRMKFEDTSPIFERIWDQVYTFVPKDSEIEKKVMKRYGFHL
nr:putative ribonuclease H-like domain-containing protein [Tanacetum cinerariifolium]